MKPSYNQACLDYSDTAYSEQTLWNKRLENRLQKTTAQLTKCIESALLVKQLHTFLVVVTCA